jgi:hypothetical protein
MINRIDRTTLERFTRPKVLGVNVIFIVAVVTAVTITA